MKREDVLEELKKRSGIMKKAVERLEEVSADEKMQELNKDREKARLDHLSSIRSAERRGAYDKAIETAKNLLNLDMEVETIASVTNLPIETVEKIKKEMKK